jgi:arylsulfatase A-like enzyme
MTCRRSFCLLATALLFACISALSQAAERKPNIVFILADDLGINDLSCYGRTDQPTPNLDKLAAQGIRFTQAYCAQPICSPSRAALMTGKTPARLHLTTFLPGRPDAPSQMLLHPKINQALPADVPTIAEMLKSAGYTTALFGKWHLGDTQHDNPIERGFDVFHAGQASTTPSDTEGGKGEYDLTSAAEKFMESNRDKPFFLFLSHNSPHIPLGAKPELIEKHKGAFNPVYAAMMETLDDSVGRVLAKLE